MEQITISKKMYGLKRISPNKLSFFYDSIEQNMESKDSQILDSIPYFQTGLNIKEIAKITDIDSSKLVKVANLIKKEKWNIEEDVNAKQHLTGEEFYNIFRNKLDDWLIEAFDKSNYWNVMLEGKGSKELFIGYLFELFHYTKNANRHMPLIVAMCPPEWKEIKQLLAKHYFEEWDHYDFFAKALNALGIEDEDIEHSDPLPATLEMSNFMRQAARKSPLCYSICSAILEGTTENSKNYGEFFSVISEKYDLPAESIQPIFDHLALDLEYDHKSLFLEICQYVPSISVEEAEEILNYGFQMVDHIYLWSEQILNKYENFTKSRKKFNFDFH